VLVSIKVADKKKTAQKAPPVILVLCFFIQIISLLTIHTQYNTPLHILVYPIPKITHHATAFNAHHIDEAARLEDETGGRFRVVCSRVKWEITGKKPQ
jgi:hypothetical protein